MPNLSTHMSTRCQLASLIMPAKMKTGKAEAVSCRLRLRHLLALECVNGMHMMQRQPAAGKTPIPSLNFEMRRHVRSHPA